MIASGMRLKFVEFRGRSYAEAPSLASLRPYKSSIGPLSLRRSSRDPPAHKLYICLAPREQMVFSRLRNKNCLMA
jgi:hypothetical protein